MQLTLDEVCINVTLTNRWMVARVQDATVRVYDYYEPGKGTTIYHLHIHYNYE